MIDARPVDPNSQAGRQLTQRILADKALLEQVPLEEPLGSEPADWPLPGAPSWHTASTDHRRPRPDPADPANTIVRLPSITDITDGDDVIIGSWAKAVGDPVQVGEPLLDAETAKVTAEIPSPVAGTVLELTVPAGDVVKKGDPIAIIGPGQPAPEVIVEYQYTLVSLTRRVAGTQWWDDVLLSDPTWFIPGRTAGGLLSAPTAGTVNALPYALVVIRNVVVSSPAQPPASMTTIGPVRVSNADVTAGGTAALGWTGMQAVGLVATVLPSLPPKDDPTLPKTR